MRGSDLVLGVASFVLPRETGPAGRRLKRIAAQLLDPATVEAAAQLVAEMEAQKKALHPEQS